MVRKVISILAAGWALRGGEAGACSCIKGLNSTPSFEVRPRGRAVHRDEHFWLLPRRAGDLALFAGKRRLKAEFRPAAGWIEVAPTEPMPPSTSVEVRVSAAGSWETIAEVRTDDRMAEALSAGGELRKIEAWDGSSFAPCSKGDPEADLTFAPFERPPPGAVPYAFWFGRPPLDTEHPPDHIEFIVGPSHQLQTGLCDERTYWLPQGEGEIQLAAAPIGQDGKRGPVAEISFAMALGEHEQQPIIERCKKAEAEARERRRGAEIALLEQSLPLARLASIAKKAAIVPALGLAAAVFALLRGKARGRAPGLAALLCALLAGASLGAAQISQQRADALEAQANGLPRPPGGECLGKYPRSRRPEKTSPR